jgi:hypothetical protein
METLVRLFSFFACAGLLGAVACGQVAVKPTATPAPVALKPTPAPPTATHVPSETTTNTPEPEREVWDYVTMGDSFTAYATWPKIYMSYLEEDLPVKVTIHAHASGSQNILAMLQQIRTNEKLRQQIMEADLITVNWGATTFQEPHTQYMLGTCGGTNGQDCLREASSNAGADWRALLDELVALRSPEVAHIITFRIGTWLPLLLCDWGSECWEGLLTHVVEWNDFVERTAIEHGIHVVDFDRAITGSDYRQPVNEAYLSGDKVHLSQEGSTVLANLLRELKLGAGTP